MLSITEVLEQDAYEYMEANSPEMLAAIETELDAGKTPGDIFRQVCAESHYHDPIPLAKRCRSAARYIQRQKG